MLIQHCIRSKQKTNKTPCISTTHSSSQSSSLAGEPVDVKVEITPPRETESIKASNTFSLESNQTLSLGLSLNEFKAQSPQPKKIPELPADALLLNTTANYGRLTPSPSSASSCKLYKKFEEFFDISLPYNHYRCLSPSESNLTQCTDGRYIYGVSRLDNKPSSTRLLRRQFSLDKEDCHNTVMTTKSSLDVPQLQDASQRSSPSPTNLKGNRLLKQNSASVAQDLEKIEEIPASPKSCMIECVAQLGQIPGSAAGSPASRKSPTDGIIPNSQSSMGLTLAIPAEQSPRAVSPVSATTICSSSTNGDGSIASDGPNNNGSAYHI